MTTTIVWIIARILGTKRRDLATGRGLELCRDVYFVPLCNITPFPMAKKSELLLSSKTSGLKNWRKLFSFVKILLALRGGKDFRSLSGEPQQTSAAGVFRITQGFVGMVYIEWLVHTTIARRLENFTITL